MAQKITKQSHYVRFDWAIKRILRDKANFGVLEGLISVLLGEKVTITQILESEGNLDSREDKLNRVDVKAKTSKGEYIIVEVQLTKERDFFQRILFGTSKSVTEQISIGLEYNVIKKIYSINILYFDFGCGDDYAYHGVTTFRGMTKNDSVLRYNNANEERFINVSKKRMTLPEEVFPEYFLLIVNHFNEVAKTPIEEWMEYLKDAVIREDTTVPGLQEAREKLAYMSMTKEERLAYEDYMISVHAAQDTLDTAKDDGWAEGMAEGLEKGLEKGLAEGRAEGLAEGIEKTTIKIAQQLKLQNVDIAVIMATTGLSKEDIESL